MKTEKFAIRQDPDTSSNWGIIWERKWMHMIEQVDASPRLEMFARRKRPGWHVWGNEIANDVEMPNRY